MAELKTEKNYYVKSIGYAKTGTGNLRAKTWYLGSVEDGQRKAQREADRIMLAWDILKASGATEWTPEAIEALKQSTPVEATAAPIMGGTSKTIKQVAEQYIDAMQDRADKGQIGSQGTVIVEKARIAKVIAIIGENVAMNRLDAKQVLAAVLAICARPMTAHPHRKAQHQMSFDSAVEYKKSFKSFLTWAGSTPMPGTADKPLWVRPMQFEEIFRQNNPVMLPADRKAELMKIRGTSEVEHFKMDELKAVYKAAATNGVKYGKLFLLLALNCGFANEEIASLQSYEIVFDEQPYIDRFRGKTMTPGKAGVYAKWPLWKETAELLKELMQEQGDNALLTPEGRRLIVKRSDYVRTSWDIVLDRVTDKDREKFKFRPMSFKYLRKTCATMVQNDLKYGEKIADGFLSHGGRGILSSYTPKDWEEVGKAVADLRKHLQPMFDYYEAHLAEGRQKAHEAQHA